MLDPVRLTSVLFASPARSRLTCTTFNSGFSRSIIFPNHVTLRNASNDKTVSRARQLLSKITQDLQAHEGTTSLPSITAQDRRSLPKSLPQGQPICARRPD